MDKREEIKMDVIDRIKDSTDSAEQPLYQLSKEQEESIDIGRTDIRNGNSHSNESLMLKMKKKFTKFLYF